jgi:hypothetical protein
MDDVFIAVLGVRRVKLGANGFAYLLSLQKLCLLCPNRVKGEKPIIKRSDEQNPSTTNRKT